MWYGFPHLGKISAEKAFGCLMSNCDIWSNCGIWPSCDIRSNCDIWSKVKSWNSISGWKFDLTPVKYLQSPEPQFNHSSSTFSSSDHINMMERCSPARGVPLTGIESSVTSRAQVQNLLVALTRPTYCTAHSQLVYFSTSFAKSTTIKLISDNDDTTQCYWQ